MFAPSSLKNESGQATIFMVIFITTMILLFAFTTNIGMLVHAKINLQNAADAAAFAGAATQARQMTAVSYLNYEMRRAVKQFLFNWMVRGNRAQACFPRSGSGLAGPTLCNRATFQTGPNDRYQFSYRDPRPSEDRYNEPPSDYIPTTCIVFDRANNYCQKSTVAGIPELGGLSGVLAFVNPIISQVQRSTDIIIQKKLDDCLSRSSANRLMLAAWLFNLDTIPPPIAARNDFEFPFATSGTLDTAGVLVRLALLRARIDNFEEALNLDLQDESFPSATIRDDTITSILSDDRREYFERPIQAYLSARNNLPQVSDNGIFSDIRMTELIPQVSNAPRNPNLSNLPVLFKLNDIRDNIKVAFSNFESTEVFDRGECKQTRNEVPIPGFPIGVTKDPSIITFYAVNLKARARLLFSPFGTDGSVDLSAYAAAKPFGSRIGINLARDPDSLIHSFGKRVSTDTFDGEFKKRHQFVNLLVSARNVNSVSDGFAANGNLGYLERAIRALPDGQRRAYRLAGAFNPWEMGFYNIPANFNSISQFLGNPQFTNNNKFELRAPVIPFKAPGTPLAFISRRIEEMFATDGILDPGNQIAEFQTIKAAYLNDDNFAQLESFLVNSGTDRVHLIPDPILLDDPVLAQYAEQEGRPYTIVGRRGQRQQLTSWNTVKSARNPDSEGTELAENFGRAGYSVRFVAFRSLIEGGIGTNDGSPEEYTDPFARLGPSNANSAKILNEIQALQH